MARKKDFFFAFVCLEKVFECLWILRGGPLMKLVAKELLIKIVQYLYKIARSCVIVNHNFIDDFLARVGLHQGTVLSPLLVIIVTKLSCCHSYQLG